MDRQAKLLYILKILWEETDETHPMTAAALADRLKVNGINCERKSIYRDLDILIEFGFDIVREHRGAYMASRLFELPELKLLVDAVQSSTFITEKKSRELIGKLSVLAGRAEADRLKRQVYIRNRVKTMNESIYYNVDRIFDAMESGCQISFCYCMWTVERRLKPRKDGVRYTISPWFLQWENERYYLVGYDEHSKAMKHFRVDKMLRIEKMTAKRLGRELYESFDIAEYARLHFSMYHGSRKEVTLLCENELAGAIIDRFGVDVWMHPVDEGHFRVTLEVILSNKFFGWLSSYAGRMQIVGPEVVCEQYYEQFLPTLCRRPSC